MTLKIAWGITGCGDRLIESYKIMKELSEKYDIIITVYLSNAGEMVLKWYRLYHTIQDTFSKVLPEISSNIPFLVGELQTGKYDMLVIMPLTSNTVAKISLGISDTMLTNAAAQAMKASIPVYIFPADQKKGEVITVLPNGKKLTLKIRDVDIEAVEKLKKMDGITVLEEPENIKEIILNKL